MTTGGKCNSRAYAPEVGWDVYYERGRKPKQSIIKHEATRSEGDYRRKVLLARLCAIEGKDMV